MVYSIWGFDSTSFTSTIASCNQNQVTDVYNKMEEMKQENKENRTFCVWQNDMFYHFIETEF